MATATWSKTVGGIQFILEYDLVTSDTSYQLQNSIIKAKNTNSKSATLSSTKRKIYWGSPDNSVDSVSSNTSTVSQTIAKNTTVPWYQKSGDRWGTRSYYRTTTAYTETIAFETNSGVTISGSSQGVGLDTKATILTISVPALPKFTINYYMDSSLGTLYKTQSQFISAHGTTRSVGAVTAPTKTGYNFVKWHCSETGAETTTGAYSSGSPITYHAYAVWTAQTSSVTLNKNGGSNGSNSVTATYNSAMPAISIPSKTGYKFLGYYDATSGGTQYYTATGASARTWNKTGSQTLYARWQALTSTVLLNNNGGSGGTGSITATYDSAMPSATMPTRAGYKFEGYYDATSGGTQYYTATGASARAWNKVTTTASGSTTVTLYAHWTSYYVTLRYNVNGGTVTTDTTQTTRWRASNGRLQRSTDSGTNWADVTDNIYTYNAVGDAATNMWNVGTPPILKTGYHVNGISAWNTNSNGTGINLNQDYTSSSTDNAVTAKRINGNKDLTSNITVDVYPKWIANEYTVALNNNEGSGGTSSITVIYDSAMPAATMPTRTGYDFKGYYDTSASSGGNRYYTETGASAGTWNKTSDTTLYARWKPKTYTVTLKQEGGTEGTIEVTATYNSPMPSATMPTRAGYVFQGYYDAVSGGNQYYTAAGESIGVWDKPNDADLYAQWRTIEPFTEGDYQYTVVDTGKVAAVVKSDSINKNSYTIPNTVIKDEITFQVTQLNNCFYNCTAESIEIFVGETDYLDSSQIQNIFNNIKYIHILATHNSVKHNIWKDIPNDQNHVEYYGIIGEYIYIIFDTLNRKYYARVLNDSSRGYNSPLSTFTTATTEMHTWTLTSMNSCYRGCTNLKTAPSIPNTVTDMTNCYNSCQVLTTVPEIPSNVILMDGCFRNCNALEGNIIVNNQPTSTTNIFGFDETGIQKEIYIINGLARSGTSSSDMISTWTNIANSYDNVYYEANNIVVTNVTCNITRDYYISNITFIPTKNNYTGAYLKTSFKLKEIQHLPVGWKITHIEASGTVAGVESPIFTVSQDINSNNIMFDNISKCLKNNAQITITVEYTIANENNLTTNIPKKTQIHTYDAPDSNKLIINVDYANNGYVYTIINSNNHEVAAYVINKEQSSYNNLNTVNFNNQTYTVTSLHYPLYDNTGNISNNDYLDYCYENCINLITAPTIPATIIDCTNCFSGCTKLQGNVVVNTNPAQFNNMFAGANVNQTKDLYIVNGGQAYPRLWRQIVASYEVNGERKHIHYEADDNDTPRVISADITRGIYNTTAHTWTYSDSDSWIRMVLKTNLLETYKPDNWANEYIREITILFRDESYVDNELYVAPSTDKKYYVNSKSIIYPPLARRSYNSAIKYYKKIVNYNKTTDTTLTQGKTYYIRSISEPYTYSIVTNPNIQNISNYYEATITYSIISNNEIDNYTIIAYSPSNDTEVNATTEYYKYENNEWTVVVPVSGDNPKESGWYEKYRYFNNDAIDQTKSNCVYVRAYSPAETIIYFEDTGVTQATAQIGVRDFFNYGQQENIFSQIIYQVFAMLDFIPGGQGMAIGKIGNRNGLDIGLPTTIGVELLPAPKFTPSQDTSNEKTYYILNNNEYVITNNPQYRQAIEFNAKEIYYEYDGEDYVEVTPDISSITDYYVGWYEKESDVDLRKSQLVIGQYNVPLTEAAFIVGNGTDDEHRSNAFVVNWDGTISGVESTKVTIVRW